MIPNITRGGRVSGLLRYLTGPGRENEHVNPRVVAGDPAAVAVWGEVDLSFAEHGAAVLELAEHLDHPRLRSPTRVTVAVKDDAGDPTGTRKDAHVWHCSLSLHPDEPALNDEQWAQIAEEFVATMGFAGGERDGRCRWVAIRHGLSKGGNDHIHIVVQLVNEHGRAASVHLDRPRAQTCARELEQTHGLRPVEGRDRGRGARATNRRQRERAAQDHDRNALRYPTPEADRDVLERAVRQAAAAASEADFVRTIRTAEHDRYLIRPRFAAGRDDQVVGYSVAIQPTEHGRAPIWHAGGKLAKDLTLPTLRTRWNAGPADQDAISEWARAWHNQPPGQQHGPSAGGADHQWELAVEELRALRAQLDALPAGERGAWADAAAQGAAVFHGWAHLAPEHAAALHRCGDQLARSAQLPAHELQAAHALPRARSAVMLCAAMMRPRNELLYWLVLAQELTALTQAVSDMHQAAGEAQRAAQIANTLREQLAPIHNTLQSAQSGGPLAPLTQRLSQASERPRQESVANDAATEAQRLARAGQQNLSPQPPPANQPPSPPPRPSTPPKRTVRRSR